MITEALFLVIVLLTRAAVGQSPNGTISGLVLDSSARVIPGAEVLIVNDATGVKYPGTTNGEGIYAVPNLPPGPYRIQVSKIGFKTLIKPDITLNVQDALAINFTLPVGAVSETVTVLGGAPLVNTESATVSTVVDRQFAENLPMNGRSFQTLIALAPGVVLTPTSSAEPGQFSVNGQRANANYFTVDGVGANTGISAGVSLGQAAGGALPGLSALGGTNTLVSVDAMQEFRIQTSSFAPEFGRSPGGQISIVTRSGTNQFHGTAFDYFRNDVLDANDWFSNHDVLPKPEERQNDFGGVLGGPIVRDRTFFFFSYEGLRLRQPLTAQTLVPSLASRQAAPSAIQPFLNAFPLPSPQSPILSGGFAQFNSSYSNPSTLDSYSIRADQSFSSKLAIFGRYSYAPSETDARNVSVLSNIEYFPIGAQTLTLGLTEAITPEINNEVRANYSNIRATDLFRLDQFGGAVPLPGSLLFPSNISSANGLFQFSPLPPKEYLVGRNQTNEQRQINLVDNLSFIVRHHQLKFGVDYRWLSPIASPLSYSQIVTFSGITGSNGAVPGTADSGIAEFAQTVAEQGSALLSRDFSLYAQDTLKASARLTLTYGLRWDVNPPLKGKNAASEPFTVQGLSNPATMTLAPRGTPLYTTTWNNFAPRFGLAYLLRQRPGRQTLLRSGFGVFYDLGSGSLGGVTGGFPYVAFGPSLINVPFPLSSQEASPPSLTVNPPASLLYVADPHLKLPRTFQWNAALEQSLGENQSLSLTYIGALGRDLLRQDSLVPQNPVVQFLQVTRNTATSDYNALQLKFQRRLLNGLQVLASYTYSHSIDIASNDSGAFNTTGAVNSANLDRGNSDFDLRHSFTSALTYDLPSPTKAGIAGPILGGWSVDSFVMVRSALPSNLTGAVSIVDGNFFYARPDDVPGVPLYLYGSQYPGDKAFNPAAFTPPTGPQGNFGRNVLRGFGAWQADFAVHRRFPITERVAMQFRAEFFNVFNHPNFGNPGDTTVGDPLFGISTQTLATSLGSGGLGGGFNPLYQIGGPRSIQLALKLQF